MDQLFAALRRFLTRDLVFVISGGAVVGAFLHLFDRLPTPADSLILYGLLAGLSYFLAYALQDLLSLTPLMTTTAVTNPNRFVRWLYRRYEHRPWQPVLPGLDESYHRFPNDEQWAEFQRIVTLQLIGTAGGPCLVGCGVLFLLRWRVHCIQFDLTLAVVSSLLGVALVCLSWLKAAQRAQFVVAHTRGDAVAV